MTDLGIGTIVALAALCLATAFLSLWLIARLDMRRAGRSIEFTVSGDDVTGMSAQGAALLRHGRGDGAVGWPQLYRTFSARFPDLAKTAAGTLEQSPGELAAAGPDDAARLTLRTVGDDLRVTLTDPVAADIADRHLRHFLEARLRDVGSVINLFPYPVWLGAPSGEVEWRNNAYAALFEKIDTEDEAGHIEAFDLTLSDTADTRTERVAVETRDTGGTHWFNVTKTRTENGGTFGFALDIDTVIKAEIVRRNFVQTLTKTFAQLSTGLAIFDRDRQLALFNPALVDLLALPAEFLSARPTLLTFFDKLRDARMMPEPKDYANWRQQITDLVIASVDGRYQETWTLPSGLTYRVTGRPHPDGAIALLFEDISAEISLTRRFRSQLNLGQAVIDTLDEAIAVFASNGMLTSSNRSFRRLWKMDPDTSFAEISIRDAMRQWQSMARPGPFWAKLNDFVAGTKDRVEWFSDIVLSDGTGMACRVTPLSGGATLVGFSLQPVLEPATQPIEENGA